MTDEVTMVTQSVFCDEAPRELTFQGHQLEVKAGKGFNDVKQQIIGGQPDYLQSKHGSESEKHLRQNIL